LDSKILYHLKSQFLGYPPTLFLEFGFYGKSIDKNDLNRRKVHKKYYLYAKFQRPPTKIKLWNGVWIVKILKKCQKSQFLGCPPTLLTKIRFYGKSFHKNDLNRRKVHKKYSLYAKFQRPPTKIKWWNGVWIVKNLEKMSKISEKIGIFEL